MATTQTPLSEGVVSNANLVFFESVTKRYGATEAISNVDFSCKAGEIRAVLGENGAGKSTLMKLLAGVIQPTKGRLVFDNHHVQFKSPSQAKALGIVCMFQELSLVPDLTVKENFLLGTGVMGFPPKGELDKAQSFLNAIDGDHISFDRKVSDLTLPERQQVEITKALCRDPRLLILDEATSALNASVVSKVFSLIREQKNQGTAVLFISHRFHEVDELADTISVFRNGQHIETFDNGVKSYAQIIELMIGQRLTELFPPQPNDHKLGETVLEVNHLHWESSVNDVSLSLRAGEILGLGGLDGQGQIDILQSLFGVLKGATGEVKLGGEPVQIKTPKQAKSRAFGIAFVPEDRKTEGLVLDLSIQDNMDLARIGRGDDQDAVVRELVNTHMHSLSLKFNNLNQAVHTLSGGNQQKVSLIKWLSLSPRCLLLADPTRGIDVKTKTKIYQLMRDLAAQGVGIVLLSTDFEELVNLCDKVHICYEGAIQSTFEGQQITPENIIAASLNVNSADHAHD